MKYKIAVIDASPIVISLLSPGRDRGFRLRMRPFRGSTGSVNTESIFRAFLPTFVAVCFIGFPLKSLSMPEAQVVTENDTAGVAGLYQTHCATCHGANLEGGPFGTPLIGGHISARWSSQKELATYLHRAMPPANPGGLPRATYGKLAEFLLVNNRNAMGEKSRESSIKAVGEYETNGGVGSAVQNKDSIYHEVIDYRTKRLQGVSPVDDEALLDPAPEDWLHWRRTYDGQGYSPLTQINRDNVGDLRLAWAKTLPAGSNAITPLVHDGVMFLNSAGIVTALDIKTGDTLWRYTPGRESAVIQAGPPVTQPRSLAIFENLLYVPTLDNYMVALDIHSGEVVWEHLIEKTDGMLRMTAGPLVVRGKLIQGMTGCFNNVPAPRGCFIVGLDARSGRELWRFHTIPIGEEYGADTWSGVTAGQRIGAGIWATGTYDPTTNLVYLGVSQTYHVAALMEPGEEGHDNSALFTNSTLALNPDTGERVWHYQHMERDVWDMDWAFERILLDMNFKGKKRRVVVTMGKLGILDALDARTGEYLFSHDLGMQNLVTGINPDTGHKTTDPALEPKPDDFVNICPFSIGVRNWPSTSYDPKSGFLYVPIGDSCMQLAWHKGRKGVDISYSPRPRPEAQGMYGRFSAIDVTAGGRDRWSARYRAPVVSSALVTAGGLAFSGGRDREFRAFSSETGKLLWRARLDNIPAGSPISFGFSGRQYVAVTTGGGHANDVTRSSQTPEIDLAEKGTTLWVFSLPDE